MQRTPSIAPESARQLDQKRRQLGSACTHVVVYLSLLNHQEGRGFTNSGVSNVALDPLSSAFLAVLNPLENIFSRLLQYANIYSFCTLFSSRYGFSFPVSSLFPPFFHILLFSLFPFPYFSSNHLC
jgi:hypothetical protein